MTVQIVNGFEPSHRQAAAALYWQAFGAKLGKVLGPDARGIDFVARVLNPDFAISAVDDKNQLLGIAGFKTAEGSMVGGDLSDIVAQYGVLGAMWRVPFLAVLERKEEQDTLCMDGICVAAEARGQGVGSRLLTAIIQEARRRNKTRVRLDVIDKNPRAKALYERQGFRVDGAVTLGPLRHVFGFERADTMYFDHS